jgi:hypothetical protein
MRIYLLTVMVFYSTLSFSQDSGLDGRVNVMECSENEVLAYVSEPSTDRDVRAYSKYKPANIQTLMSQQDGCSTLLYEDLNEMNDQLNGAMGAISSGFSNFTISSFLTNAWDYMSGTICDRVDSGLNVARETSVAEIIQTELDLISEAESNAEVKALGSVYNVYEESMEPSDNPAQIYGSAGGGVMPNDLQGSLKSKWARRLRELNRELPSN